MIVTIEEYLRLADSDSKEDTERTVHEELSSEVISKIINEYPEKKCWLIHNKKIPLSVLKVLSIDCDEEIRFTIAMKRKCDRELFETLMKDSAYSVRMAIVRNKKIPLDLLESMKNDFEIEISEEAGRIFENRTRNLDY